MKTGVVVCSGFLKKIKNLPQNAVVANAPESRGTKFSPGLFLKRRK
jgi:hypothetical protein